MKHKVRIRCPECDTVQAAQVEIMKPWNMYWHQCVKCGYVIMESEWDEVKEQGNV